MDQKTKLLTKQLDEGYTTGYKSPATKRKEAKMAVTVKKPLSTPSTSAASDAPFAISSGARSAAKYLKIFIYGDYGSGKTVLAAQSVDVPSMRDVLFINIESGIQSIIGSGAIENTDAIDIVPGEGESLQNFEQFVAIYKMLVSYCQARDDDDQERLDRMAKRYGFDAEKRYKTVVIDSLSELNQISLSRAFGENSNDLLSFAGSDDTRRDYGRNRESIIKTIRAFRNLPMNVIATCGCEWDEDERKKVGYMPRLTGKLSKEVQAYWDVIGFLKTSAVRNDEGKDTDDNAGQVLRRLWLQPIGKFDAKNRLSGQETTHLDDPTMGRLVALLTKGQSKPKSDSKERDKQDTRKENRVK